MKSSGHNTANLSTQEFKKHILELKEALREQTDLTISLESLIQSEKIQ